MITQESKHALLSASSSHRWIHCTPSARLEEGFEDKDSDFAAEGTLAHEICELKLRKAFTEPSMTTRSLNSKMKKIKENQYYQEEMQGYTDVYVDYISQIIYGFETAPYIAIEKRIDYSAYAPEGFGTADCIIIKGNTLRVIDFKYGKGVSVDSENNPQMMLYALGAIQAYGFIYPIQNVIMTIVQPRLDSISEFEISVSELIKWGNEVVIPAANKAIAGMGEYVPGNHCGFCKAKASCRVRAEENLKMAQYEFAKPPLLTNDEIGGILNKAKDLAKWSKDLEEYALAELVKGNAIKGHKLVEGRSNRQFINQDNAFTKIVAAGFAEEVLYERKPIAMTAVEKLLGKKQFGELLSADIEKPRGKPTIAPENDKRPVYEIKSSAEEDFKTPAGTGIDHEGEDLPF